MSSIIVFTFGLIIGSFVTVASYALMGANKEEDTDED